MLRDVFYYGNKPNVHPREKFAKNLDDARSQATTVDFWIINEHCDYRGFDWDFDFEFLHDDDVWAEDHINVWPSQHQKDSGTWLCNTANTEPLIIYRADVEVVKRKNIKSDCWVELDSVNHLRFDFSWHPDPTDPPYVYAWGSKFTPVQYKTCLEYRVPGATQIKYMNNIVELLPNDDCWIELQSIDKDKFDMSWRPDPREPAMIYVWGNKYVPGETVSTLEYHVPGAIEKKFMLEKVSLLPSMANWELFEEVDKTKFDFAWIPDPSSPPFIYAWGNQWNNAEDKISIQYAVEGATEYKYMSERAVRKPQKDNWVIPTKIDMTDFDFSWEPSPAEPPFIYQFGTQWQKTGGPRYIVEGATEVKFIDLLKAKSLPTTNNWTLPTNIDVTDFDFSWHPDDTSPPYIYVFPTQWALSGGPTYTVEGATEVKYIEDLVAKAVPDRTNWEVPAFIDTESFDFSWHPYAQDEPYIYQFGTQWQKTGGPVYKTPGIHANSATKYIDTRILKAKRLPSKKGFATLGNNKIDDFDYSWHPDTTDEPYIYVFGNNLYPAEVMPTIEYAVPGAKQIKYVGDIVATLGANMMNWEVPDDIDTNGFDFSWKPNPKDPEFIYEFGTQWQKTGGPRYIVEGATEVKFIDTHKVIKLPTTTKWSVSNNIDVSEFDFSWHPDATSPPYIYYFATQWALSGGPVYSVEGATEIKYVEDIIAKALPDKTNWENTDNIDVDSFDFSWHPYTEDEPYIYKFGTQWQKTGGPVYKTPGVHANSPVKYVDPRVLKATRLPSKKHWRLINNYKIKDFDYSWHPDETDEEKYIYIFGNNFYSAEVMPTLEYYIPGASKPKYVSDIIATLGADKTFWEVPKHVDATDFDFSWKPNPHDPPYIYQFGTQWQKTGGPRYTVMDATEIKYIDTSKATATSRPNDPNWHLPEDITIAEFDYSWHPDATENIPYIYVFGTQWALSGGPKYIVPGATIVKYVEEPVATAASNRKNWIIPDDIDTETFDFSWHPYSEDDPYIYQFGTQWQKTGGPKYVASGADDTSFTKYIDTRILKATKLPNKKYWVIPESINEDSVEYSWHPDESESPYIYKFGTQWFDRGGPEYHVPGAINDKFSDAIIGKIKSNRKNWTIPNPINEHLFDFSWTPHPDDPPYIYQFGTQWAKTNGPIYIVSGATETKYVDAVKSMILPDRTNWEIPSNIDVSSFDFSWHPDMTAPKYIYQFGTLLDDVHLKDGPRYITPGNDGEIVYLENILINGVIAYPRYYITTTLEDLIAEHRDEIFWAMRENIDYKNFDFDWTPDKEQVFNINVFGSAESEATQTYFVNAKFYNEGYTDKTYLEDKTIDEINLADLFVKPNMFFVDRGNQESKERFEKLKQQFPDIQKTRYLNTWVDTINRCINRSSTELCWILNSELDYTNFEFNYYPNPWQMKMVHVFGTQWSHWGTTFMVNRETFAEDTKYIKIIEHLSNLNFLKDRRAKATNVLYDIVYIDHGNMGLYEVGKTIVKYEESYFNTFKKLLEKLPVKKEHYIWVCSSVCDYYGFDFTYICDPFARDQLHVFPSDKQKFGDTFLVNVNKLRELIIDMETLSDYEKINYNQHQRVKRLAAPVIITEGDTHASSIDTQFDFPYATLQTSDNKDIQVIDTEPMNLWSPETKNIIITSAGGTRITVPKEAKEYVKRELYDYPYIITNSKLAKSSTMDIVFLSNGETGADANYEHLLRTTHGLDNRVVRVDGVNGRVAAYHAAAEASNTAWMFTVFAKLKVSNKFDWNWQPDRLQIPKHYVFHAKNPVNGLVYGHQAMIAYNKKLTLANEGKGLDFTMDDEHEVVEINSGIAVFNTDEWSTWRTSFREALKLRANTDEVSKTRLEMWLTVGMGKFNEYSMEGAQHAVEYYDSVNGDFDKLKLSYEWSWLRSYFESRYK